MFCSVVFPCGNFSVRVLFRYILFWQVRLAYLQCVSMDGSANSKKPQGKGLFEKRHSVGRGFLRERHWVGSHRERDTQWRFGAGGLCGSF